VADIFISYSRKDTEAAKLLAELLGANGYDVWIDVKGIHAATAWSREIVEAIDSCKVFIVLLSTNSLASPNVTKEVSLASESRKTIFPIDVEKIELTVDLRYQLAGIQRVSIHDKADIISGLDRLNIKGTAPEIDATQVPKPVSDGRLPVAVLPFDDLSPGKDNDWFADGLTDELINVLSELNKLRVTDRRTAMGFRGFKGNMIDIAKGLNVRYIIEGAVRKHADQIKITVQLYDALKSETLWNDSHKGIMDDIFDIQESVARKTVESLKLTLSLDEQKMIESRPTENSKAYEYYLRAIQLADLNTRTDYEKALVLLELCLELDPSFAEPYTLKSLILTNLYRVYDKSEIHLKNSGIAIEKALANKPELREAYLARATLFTVLGRTEEAIDSAQKVIELNPNLTQGYFALGFIYSTLGNSREAIEWYQKAKAANPDNTFAYWNIFVHSTRIQNDELTLSIINEAIPVYLRRLELNSNDNFLRSNLVSFYIRLGRTTEAADIINSLIADPSTDSMILYNIACQYARSGDNESAMDMLKKAFRKGFQNTKLVQSDTDLDTLRARDDFKQLLEEYAS
jgi:adenylate cyclase